MERKTSSIVIDKIFLILSTFFITFIWIRYHVHNTFLILLYTSILTFVICSIIHIFYKKKQKKYNLSKKDSKNIENLSFFLNFQTKQQVLNYFKTAIENKNFTVKTNGNFLVFEQNILYANYLTTCTNQNDIIDIVVKAKSKNFTQKNLVICSPCFNDEAKKITRRVTDFNIQLLNEKDVYYKLFKPIALPIEKVKNKKTKKQKALELLNIAFNKKRFKGYFFSAIILLIGSYFLRYNLYYLIFASILSIFAIFSYFNTTFNKKTIDIFENTNSLTDNNN